jgi:hypothetical protein
MKTIFGTFAESMNKIELWTGEGPPNPNVSISWANKLRLSVCAYYSMIRTVLAHPYLSAAKIC